MTEKLLKGHLLFSVLVTLTFDRGTLILYSFVQVIIYKLTKSEKDQDDKW